MTRAVNMGACLRAIRLYRQNTEAPTRDKKWTLTRGVAMFWYLAIYVLNGPTAVAQQTPHWPAPPEAELTTAVNDPPGRHSVATGPSQLDQPPLFNVVEGPRQRIGYRLPGQEHAQFNIFRRIQATLAEAGWSELFACAEPECGGYDFRHSRAVLPLPEMFVNIGSFYYLSARPPDRGGALEVLISGSGGDAYLQISRLNAMPLAAAPQTPPPAAAGDLAAVTNPQSLEMELRRHGRVVIKGLQFEQGTAAVDSAQSPLIAILGAWLAADRTRRIALVGHSDWTGSFEANRRLAQDRAKSVADILITQYETAAEQLEVRGAAYLAPLAGNATAENRDMNRRVEAVLRPAAR